MKLVGPACSPGRPAAGGAAVALALLLAAGARPLTAGARGSGRIAGHRPRARLAPEPTQARIYGAAVTREGGIVVAGPVRRADDDDADFAVARYRPDGHLDPTFGRRGITVTNLGGDDEPHALALQADGRIVVAGYSDVEGSSRFALARYRPDGHLDPSFGKGGTLVTGMEGKDVGAYGVAIQEDGKIVLAGYSDTEGSSRLALARYRPDGQLDPAFGNAGRVFTDMMGTDVSANAVTLQPDGKVVLAGYSDTDHSSRFAAARYDARGQLDTSFGTAGRVITDVHAHDVSYFAIAAAPAGALVAAGYAQSGEEVGTRDVALARYRPDGTPDPAFGKQGIVTTQLGGSDSASALLLQPDGRLVVAGYSDTEGSSRFALARYDADGRLDASFGRRGITLVDVGGDDVAAASVVRLGDGRLIAAGYAEQEEGSLFALVCCKSDGKLDPAFGSGGKVTTAVGVPRGPV